MNLEMFAVGFYEGLRERGIDPSEVPSAFGVEKSASATDIDWTKLADFDKHSKIFDTIDGFCSEKKMSKEAAFIMSVRYAEQHPDTRASFIKRAIAGGAPPAEPALAQSLAAIGAPGPASKDIEIPPRMSLPWLALPLGAGLLGAGLGAFAGKRKRLLRALAGGGAGTLLGALLLHLAANRGKFAPISRTLEAFRPTKTTLQVPQSPEALAATVPPTRVSPLEIGGMPGLPLSGLPGLVDDRGPLASQSFLDSLPFLGVGAEAGLRRAINKALRNRYLALPAE